MATSGYGVMCQQGTPPANFDSIVYCDALDRFQVSVGRFVGVERVSVAKETNDDNNNNNTNSSRWNGEEHSIEFGRRRGPINPHNAVWETAQDNAAPNVDCVSPAFHYTVHPHAAFPLPCRRSINLRDRMKSEPQGWLADWHRSRCIKDRIQIYSSCMGHLLERRFG